MICIYIGSENDYRNTEKHTHKHTHNSFIMKVRDKLFIFFTPGLSQFNMEFSVDPSLTESNPGFRSGQTNLDMVINDMNRQKVRLVQKRINSLLVPLSFLGSHSKDLSSLVNGVRLNTDLGK